eukprot:6397-Eustigmatos_ZCMA.PRE.1
MAERRLVTVKLADEVVVLYRHLCLHTCVKYQILPKSSMNMDIIKSRDTPLLKKESMQKRLGLKQIDVDTMIGLLDDYLDPDTEDKRGYSKRNVLALTIHGTTETQKTECPTVQ